MAKQHTTITSSAAGTGAPAARAVEPVTEPSMVLGPVAETDAPTSVPEHVQIARLAYSYWQDRGCPEGSPEEDWLRAEAELSRQAAGTRA